MKIFDSPTKAIEDLRRRGYCADFKTAVVCLYCGDLDMRLHPEDFHIEEVYQFLNEDDADDIQVVYGIISTTGVKGILADVYKNQTGKTNTELYRKLQSQMASWPTSGLQISFRHHSIQQSHYFKTQTT